MPNARLALMGADEGPWISIKGIRNPVARVSGLAGILGLEVIDSNAVTSAFLIHADGEHRITAGDWLRARCQAAGKHKTICQIVNIKKAS